MSLREEYNIQARIELLTEIIHIEKLNGAENGKSFAMRSHLFRQKDQFIEAADDLESAAMYKIYEFSSISH